MKKWLLLLLALAGFAAGRAQNFRLAYFGENLTHYGVRTGMEYVLNHRETDKGNGLFASRDWLFGLNLTVFRHPNNHLGFILAPELGWRHTGRRGGVVQFAIAPSLFRSVLEGKTYEWQSDGSLKKTPLAGRWGFLPTFSLGYGRDLSVQHNRPLIWFANLHYMRQYPYNSSALNRFALELGIIHKTTKFRP